MEEQIIERQTAKIVSIKDITTGKYHVQEGYNPNYILTSSNEKVNRVNIVGIVVTVPADLNSVFIDDGSSKIEIRTFDNNDIFKGITIGDIVLVVGKPREYNNEIYINAEIIKKITNKGWLEFRKKEIMLKTILNPKVIPKPEKTEIEVEKPEQKAQTDAVEEMLDKIKELDSGNGCDIQDLVSNDPNKEKIIEDLLLKGDIFEISPGKVKILE
jgi:RPA family protein